MKIRTIPLFAAILAVCTLAGSWIAVQGGHPPVAAGSPDLARQVSFINGFTAVAKHVLPAVVNISSSRMAASSGDNSRLPMFSDPLFRQFFRGPARRQESVGSGVIVSASGYVLTNYHLIAGSDQIDVSLGDKRELKARVAGTDPKTDIAVLKLDATGLPAVTLGDSSTARVGDFALAVGNAFGIGQTITMGIVSATGRTGLGLDDYEDFIQTDAAVNPGNSGGPLVNVRGELIGINTAIVTGSGGNQGVGFAVPVNMASAVMDEILKHGRVIRGWLGVALQPVTREIAQAFGLTGRPRGGLVAEVAKDSPAARCGIAKGDIILELDGAAAADSQELHVKIAMLAPGTAVKLKVLHEGREREVVVKLEEAPAPREAPGHAPSEGPGPGLGMSVNQLTPRNARQLGFPPQSTGVVVVDITPGGPADKAGLLRGDLIQEVDRKPVATADRFQNVIRRTGKQPVLLFINRRGSGLYSVVPAR